jgi:excisionase family DNA binding protein
MVTRPAIRDRLLSVKQVAELFNVRPQYVYRLLSSNRLTPHYIGRHVRISETEALAFIKVGRW